MEEFTYQSRLRVKTNYRNNSKWGPKRVIWTQETVEKLRSNLRKNKLHGSYGIDNVNNIYNHLKQHMLIQNQRVLIIGSQKPWLEAIVLEAGAKHITTLDYASIESQHPQIETILPKHFALKFLNGTLGQFDVMVTFSSLEHSGLGRYGDGLNPYGDLITMARVWCALKDGGMALIGVPTGPDALYFNSFKLYGPLMYSHLFANFEQIFSLANISNFGHRCPFCYQPLHILRKNLTLFEPDM